MINDNLFRLFASLETFPLVRPKQNEHQMIRLKTHQKKLASHMVNNSIVFVRADVPAGSLSTKKSRIFHSVFIFDDYQPST